MVRILIIGNFSGRRANDTRPGTDIPSPSARIDRDELDSTLAAVAPEIRLALDDTAGPVILRPRSMEDFHPDRLLDTAEPLRALAAMRDGIVSARPAASASAPSSMPASTDALLSGASLLDQIIGDAPAPAGPAAPSRDELGEFVQRAVQPHLAAAETPAERDIKAKIDDARRALLRVILHAAAFRELEAAWRSVEFLLRRLDTDEAVDLRIVDLSRDELVQLLANEPARVMRSFGEAGLVVGLYEFGLADVGVLEQLARLAEAMRAPWVVTGAPDLAGAADFRASSDPDDWTRAVSPEWQRLRALPNARWLSVAVPRFLMRVPYGKRSEPCERLDFEEFTDWPDHDSLVWGHPGVLVAAIVGEGAEEGTVPTQGVVGGLAMYVGRRDGVAEALPCAELMLTQRDVAALLDRGLTPLAAQKDGDAVRIPRLQSIASPATPLPFREIGE